METKADVPECGNQWHGARVFGAVLKSQSDELFIREKEWRRLRAPTGGISTLCLGLVDKISSGSHSPRKSPLPSPDYSGSGYEPKSGPG